jgi:hypothetical protein
MMYKKISRGPEKKAASFKHQAAEGGCDILSRDDLGY